MKLQELEDYILTRAENGLTKIEPKLEADTDLVDSDFYVTKTKETYVFGSEDEADTAINEARVISGFTSAKKKFKAGKVSKKTGETLVDDSWIVVIELEH